MNWPSVKDVLQTAESPLPSPRGQKGQSQNDGTNIKVMVRLRPFSQRERDLKCKLCVHMPTERKVVLIDEYEAPSKQFDYDFAAWSHDEQDLHGAPLYWAQSDVYEKLGSDMIKNVFEGFNCTLFAYGQTGSGKSWTVLGGPGDDSRGLLPRLTNSIFEYSATQKKEHSKITKFLVSFLEIYNEEIKDLLHPQIDGQRQKLDVRQHPTRGIYVPGLTEAPVESLYDVNERLDFGTKSRTVAATQMNATSSRSHCIFTVQCILHEEGQKEDKGQHSEMHIVDLAGSERQKKTGANRERLMEGAAINKSLTTLSMCISALAPSDKKQTARPPFRDSKLTFLLRDSLSGSSKTAMTAHISPADDNYDETLSTLHFASSVKAIKTSPMKRLQSVVLSASMVAQLKAELERTKDELAKAQQIGGPSDGAGTAKSYIRRYQDGEAIVSEGDDAQEMFIINSGLVSVEVNGAEIMEKHEGDIFGEQAVLGLANKRTATVRAKGGEVEVRILTRQVFTYSADYVMDMKGKFDETLQLLEQYEMSWQERCEQEEGYQRERRKTLADLGLADASQKRRNAVPDLVTPYMKNISADPSLCGTLLYMFDAQDLNTIGSGSECKIKLNGLGIKPFMCQISNQDDVSVRLSTRDPFHQPVRNAMRGAPPRILINGKALREDETELRHGDRLIIGHAFCFHLQIPRQRIEESGRDPKEWRKSLRRSSRKRSSVRFDVSDPRKIKRGISFGDDEHADDGEADEGSSADDDVDEGDSEASDLIMEENFTLEEALDEARRRLSESHPDEDQPIYLQYLQRFEMNMDKESYMWLTSVFEEAYTLCEEANELSKELRPDDGFMYTAQILSDAKYEESTFGGGCIPMEERYTVLIRQFQSDAKRDKLNDDGSAVFHPVGVFDLFDLKDRLEAMREIYQRKNFLHSAVVDKHSHNPWGVIGYLELQQVVAEVAEKQWESMEQTMSWMNKSSRNMTSIADRVGKGDSDSSSNDGEESDEDDVGGHDHLSSLPTFEKHCSEGAPVNFTSLKWMVSEQKRRMSNLVEDISKRRASSMDVRLHSMSAGDDARLSVSERHNSMLATELKSGSDVGQTRARVDTGHFGRGSLASIASLSDRDRASVTSEAEKSPQEILREIVEYRGQLAEQKNELLKNDENTETLLREEGAFAEECKELRTERRESRDQLRMEFQEELLETQFGRQNAAKLKEEVEESERELKVALGNGELRQELLQAMEDLEEARAEHRGGKAEVLQHEEDVETLLNVEEVFAEECEELSAELSNATSQDTRKLQEEVEQQKEELEDNAQDVDVLLNEQNAFALECEKLRVDLEEAQEGMYPSASSNEDTGKRLVEENTLLRSELMESQNSLRDELAEQQEELLESVQDIETLLSEENSYAEECEELRIQLMDHSGNREPSHLKTELVKQSEDLKNNKQDIETLLAEETLFATECEELNTELDKTRAGILQPSTAAQEKLKHAEEEIHDQQDEIYESYKELQSMGVELARAKDELIENAEDMDLLLGEEENAKARSDEFHIELEEVSQSEDAMAKMSNANIELLLNEEITLKEGYIEVHEQLRKAESNGASKQISEALSQASKASSEAESFRVTCKDAEKKALESSKMLCHEQRSVLTLREEIASLQNVQRKLTHEVAVSKAEARKAHAPVFTMSDGSQDLLKLQSDLRISAGEAREAGEARSKACIELLRVRDELSASTDNMEATQERLTEELFHVAKLSGMEQNLRSELNEALLNAKSVSRFAEDAVYCLQAHESSTLREELRVALSKSSLHSSAYLKLDVGLREALEELNESGCKSYLLRGVMNAISRFRIEIRDSLSEVMVAGLGGAELPGLDMTNAILRQELHTLLIDAGEEYEGISERAVSMDPSSLERTQSALSADSLRGSSIEIGTIQRSRRLAWPLRKDDTQKSRSVNNLKAYSDTYKSVPSVPVTMTPPVTLTTEPLNASVASFDEYEQKCKRLPEFEAKAAALWGSLGSQHVAAAEGVRGVRTELGRLRTKVKSTKSLVGT